jgi:hypothetical protein
MLSGAPATSAMPQARTRPRLIFDQARMQTKRNRALRMPRCSLRAVVTVIPGRSSHSLGRPRSAASSSSRERARSVSSTRSDNSATESRPCAKWRRSAVAANSRSRSPTSTSDADGSRAQIAGAGEGWFSFTEESTQRRRTSECPGCEPEPRFSPAVRCCGVSHRRRPRALGQCRTRDGYRADRSGTGVEPAHRGAATAHWF